MPKAVLSALGIEFVRRMGDGKQIEVV